MTAPTWLTPQLADLYEFKRTNTLSRDDLSYESGTIRNIHYGDIHTTFRPLFIVGNEYVPYVNLDAAPNEFEDEAFCEEGDIVIADASEDLDDVGKAIEVVSLSGERVVAGMHTILATRRGSVPVAGFGGQLFQSAPVRAVIRKEAQGTKVYGISAKRISAIPVPVPPTEAEQQKIANCLGSLDDLITAEDRKLDALRQHKQGLMQQLFPQPGRTAPLGNKNDWKMLDLPEVTFFQEGPGILAVDFCTEGVPLVRLSGLAGDTVTLDGCDYLNPDKVAQKWKHFRLVDGDLLISTSATFGRVSVVTEPASGAVFYTGLVRFRSIDKRLSDGFLKAYLESPDFLRQARSHAVGGGIKHFGPTHLRQMQIRVPPLADQRQIASCLSSVDACITGQSIKLQMLNRHKQGLLQQLFPSPEAE